MKKIILALILLTVFGCNHHNRREKEYVIFSKSKLEETANADSKNVLIAYSKNTAFKGKIISELQIKLNKRDHTTKVIKLKDYDLDMENSYDVILLIDEGMWMRASRVAKRSLKKTNDRDKYLLFTTVGGEHWEPKEMRHAEVDGIVSASKIERVDSISDELVYKIEMK